MERKEEDAKRLGENLKKIRLSKKWSQDRLARESAITSRSISSMEGGKHVPTLNTLSDIAKALDIPTAALLT